MTREIVSSIQQTRSNNSLQPHARIEAWQLELMRSAGSGAFVLVPWLALYVGRGTKPSEAHFSPRLKTLAQKTGMNERTIRRCIARLVGVGLLQCDRITGSSRNLYRLATSAAQADLWRAAARSKASPSSSLARKRANKTMTRQRTTKPPPCLFDVETLAATVGAWKTPLLEPALFTKLLSCPPSDDAPETDAKSPPRVDNGVHPMWTIDAIPCGQLTTVSKNERENISTAKADTCEPKTTKKTVSIRQEKQTKETDNNKQGPTMFYPPVLQSSAAAVVVVQNLSMSQETEPTAEQLHDDHNLLFGETKGSLETCIRQFGDAQKIGSNFGADGEYQYWPEYENPKTLEAFTVEQVLGHYKLCAKLSHIAKALKETQGQGIPTIELAAAIVWKLRNISPTQDGGLAWNMLDRNLAGTWNQWQQHTTAKLERAASKQRQAERERKDEQQRRAQQEHDALERMARFMEQDAENERLYFVAEQERSRKLEHDARPENVLERTLLEIASLVHDLEQLNAKNCARLAERATQNEKQEAELVAHSKSAHWQANPKAFEDFKKTLHARSTKARATEDAEYRVAIDIINGKLEPFRSLAKQLRQALAEAA